MVVLVALSGCMGGGSKDANEAPQAKFTVKPGATPQTFKFDASGSVDPDEDALEYWWNFGDGSDPVQGRMVEYEYVVTDTAFSVSLVVRDARGLSGVALQTVSLGSGRNSNPEPSISDANRWLKPGQTLTLDASASHDADGDQFGFDWTFGPRVPASETTAGLKNPCTEKSTNAFIFSTGCLSGGQAFNLTLDQTGTYAYHCHPHPWMKANLVVAPDADVSGSHEVDIENFHYSERVLRVKPGTTVVFTNKDPVPHTASVEYYSPGESKSKTPVLQASPEPGDYTARLTLTDFKGGLASATWGVRVSDDAPEDPKTTVFSKPIASPPQTSLERAVLWHNISFATRIDATLDWGSTSDQIQAELTIVQINDKGEPAVVEQCAAQPIPMQAGKLNMACRIDAGSYQFRVAAKEGSALAQWTLTVIGYPYATPGFGDTAGGGHHH